MRVLEIQFLFLELLQGIHLNDYIFKLESLLVFMGNFLFRVHESYRWVVSICDKEVYGRKLVEGERVLDLTGDFFKGEERSEEEIRKEIGDCVLEDATFNLVGENSVRVALDMGIIKEEGVMKIEGVPFALSLL